MKESISYTFILNIVIVFIFTCFAVVMGTLSYYKAFRANSIIAETIEKYEGFNCVSREEIARKLNNVGYETPFSVDCNGKGDACIADNDFGYVVTSYNLDMPNEKIVYNDESYLYYNGDYYEKEYYPMNSSYKCNENGCTTNKHYQYGIYTYMYVEMPVISQLLRLSFFSKTNTMYEFRNYFVENNIGIDKNTRYTNIELTPEIFSIEEIEDSELGLVTYVKDAIIGKKACHTDVVGSRNVTTCDYETTAIDLLASSYGHWMWNTHIYHNDFKYIFQTINSNIGAKTLFGKRLLAIKKNLFEVVGQLNNGEYIKYGEITRHKCGYIRDYSAF